MYYTLQYGKGERLASLIILIIYLLFFMVVANYVYYVRKQALSGGRDFKASDPRIKLSYYILAIIICQLLASIFFLTLTYRLYYAVMVVMFFFSQVFLLATIIFEMYSLTNDNITIFKSFSIHFADFANTFEGIVNIFHLNKILG